MNDIKKPRFFVIEGPDGIGKTELLQNLSNVLVALGVPLVLTKQPGDAKLGSCIGQQLRDIIFQGVESPLAPGVAAVLFVADSIQNQSWVSGELKKGNSVLCDRYTYSNLAYWPALNEDQPYIIDICHSSHKVLPDAIIYLRPVIGGSGPGLDLRWCFDRANQVRPEGDKQSKKKWNNYETFCKVVSNYDEMFITDDACYVEKNGVHTPVITVNITDYTSRTGTVNYIVEAMKAKGFL